MVRVTKQDLLDSLVASACAVADDYDGKPIPCGSPLWKLLLAVDNYRNGWINLGGRRFLIEENLT